MGEGKASTGRASALTFTGHLAGVASIAPSEGTASNWGPWEGQAGDLKDRGSPASRVRPHGDPLIRPPDYSAMSSIGRLPFWTRGGWVLTVVSLGRWAA
jgi:hypothetical protein